MFNQKLLKSIISLTVLSTMLVGCGQKTSTPNLNNISNSNEIEIETTEIAETNESDENLTYKSNEIINVSGTDLIMYEPYQATFYNADIDFIDIDFQDYNFGISLPKSVFDPNKLYYIDESDTGTVQLKTGDANKIILNFMDDYHYTTFCYSTGVFSTWSYTIDEETYSNLMYSNVEDIVTLLENEEQVVYKTGYAFEKHYDNKEENAYRIIMEVDYYPFVNEFSTVFYHGYMVLLVHNTDVRAVVFAEPKYDTGTPYQMGYPVIDSCYWLDVPVLHYSEDQDLEALIKATPTPTATPTIETTETPTVTPTTTIEITPTTSETEEVSPTPTMTGENQYATPTPTEVTPTPTQALSSSLNINNK